MRLFRSITKFVLVVTLTACTGKNESSTPAAAAEEKVLIFNSKTEFPACVDSMPGKIYFSVEEGLFFICRDGAWVETKPPSATETAADESAGAALGLCGTETEAAELPAVVPVSGQLAVSLPDGTDPCSATGYVVGFQDELPLKHAADGGVYFDNLPAGNLDLIITADGGAGLVTTGKRGIRISDVTSLPGVRRDLKDFSLPQLSSISGNSKIGTGSDHAGILVYIPGTDYAALTDKDGNFSLRDVPAGKHNLYFEKDGYHRGQIENISVTSEKSTLTPPITLQISTGAEGFIVLAGNAAVSQEWEVAVTVGATPNAVLMKISESPTFDNLAWSPVVTSMVHTFASEGEKTVYAKFADANGLESSPFSAKITVDRFIPEETSLTALAGVSEPSLSRTISFQHTKPKHVTDMVICVDSTFSGCSWQPFAPTFSYTFAGEGSRTLYVRYRDGHQFESHDLSSAVNIDLFPAADLSFKINNGTSSTNNRNVNLTMSDPVNAHSMIVCEDSSFSSCSWEGAATTKSWNFGSDGYKTLYLKFRDQDLFESEVLTASILVDTEAPSGTPTVSYTVRQANLTLNSFSVSDLHPMEMKAAAAADFAGATWQPFSGSLSLPYSRNLKVQYRDSYGHETGVIDLKTTYTHTLSEARSSIASGRAGNIFVFAGGYKSGGVYSDVVDIYDSASAFWTTATLSEARSGAAVAVSGTKIYFAGGSRSGGCSAAVDILDTSTGTWSLATLSQARCSISAAAAGSKVLFAGGSNGSTVYSTVDIFDTVTSTWSTGSLSVARRLMAGLALGSDIYFIGGNTNTGTLMSAAVDVYDSTTGSWSTADSLNAAKRELTAIAASGKIYVAGGYMQSVPIETDAIESYDPLTDTWTTEASVLSSTRHAVGAASADGLVFFIGGVDYPSASGGSTNPSSIVDIFNPSDGSLTSSSPLSTPRKFHAVESDGTVIIVAGGSTTSNNPTNKVDFYEAGSWRTSY